MKILITEEQHKLLSELNFIVDKKDKKFKLFSGEHLVSESGFNIERPDEWFKQKYVTIHDLKTNKEYLRKGFAEHLLEQIFDYVKNVIKLNIIALIVDKDNTNATNLYFKVGFEVFMEYDDSYSLIKKL